MFVKNDGNLFLSPADSDVTIVIGEIELPAHRSILSKRSEYFKTMFSSSFVEVDSNKITLKETDFTAFTSVLKYIYDENMSHIIKSKHIYNSSISLDEAFKLYACADFYMVDDLAVKILDFMKSIKPDNPYLALSNALTYSLDELTSYGTDQVKMHTPCFLKGELEHLSPPVVEYILKLRLNTLESNIFEALVWWMRCHPEYSSEFAKFLQHIDLWLIEEEQLEKLFNPTPLVDRTFVQNLLNEQRKKTQVVHKVVNQNVISGADNLRIVSGNKSMFCKETVLSPHASENHFTIDLKQLYLINCLKFNLLCDSYYTIFVSKDMRNWKRVINHSKYKCFGPQLLYFKERAVWYIRIQRVDGGLVVKSNIEALYSTDSVKIDPATKLIVPNSPKTKPAILYSGHSFTWKLGHVYVFQLTQPCFIGSVRLFLSGISGYFIEVSTDKKYWERVFAEGNVSGWRIAAFPKRPVVFFKIGSRAPYFDVNKFEYLLTP